MNMSAMNISIGRCLPALAFGATLTALMGSAAWAQTPPGTGLMGQNHMAPRSAPEKPPVALPDAIPGSKPRDPVAPATRAAGDMQPTDALFDAINRGDIAAARDALNRGADQSGVNVLGMTPMELSVDLGRNDISFLLLSMRGEDSGRGSRAAGRDATTPAFGPVQAARPVPGVGNKQVAAKAPALKSVATPKLAATPKLFANDGGTPVPSAGFLGFGSRSAAN
jgi:hypothetical protein